MNNILIVAAREFRQIVSMKSFWLTLLLIPFALLVGPLFADTLDDDDATKVMIVDRANGGTADAIARKFAIEQDRANLSSFAKYVRRHDLERADPDAPWAQFDRWYTDADVAAFREAGGIDAARERIAGIVEDGTPEYELPPVNYKFIEPPAALAQAQDSDWETQVDAAIDPDEGEALADYVVLIGADYAQQAVVRLWSNDTPRLSFVETLQDVLTVDLRNRLLADQGVSADASAAVQTAQPAIAVTTPPPGDGAREALLVRSIIPLALAYILMMSLVLSGSWMLQSSVEERSNKLIESLLACVRADQLMWGKLIGTVAVGLSMILFWAICAGIIVFTTQGMVADYIRPALEPISDPGIILAIIYFFIAGYIAVSIIFLAIGSMSDTMNEAQGFLMPILFAILLPVTLVLQAILLDNTGPLVHVLTWIPLWTPFTVLARLGAGIEAWELIGSGLMLAGFIVLEFVYLGRLFRASLLATGQKAGFKTMIARLKG
ncbi:MAG: ABC transporter permease [Pontixanthobacter sp.]